MQEIDVIIVGAGAAGLMCAIEAAKRGRRVLVIEHNNRVGKKILMSGGGYCNFTNYFVDPEKYHSHNPHFYKSALSRYTQWDFIAFVERYKIAYHEKTLGQLFCNEKASILVNALLKECQRYQVTIMLKTKITQVKKTAYHYCVKTSQSDYQSDSLVVATGGLSIPTMGATPFGYQLASQFNLNVYPTCAGLVPLTLHVDQKEKFSALSGISMDCLVSCSNIYFRESLLFTHRGFSGPAILQISSYWEPGNFITINCLPEIDLAEELVIHKNNNSKSLVKTILQKYFPKRVVSVFVNEELANNSLQKISYQKINELAKSFQNWRIQPNGTEGYRTAEVTLGGVDCNVLSSKTMEVKDIPGLYFIGEVVDVAGWLGGYNFQWAWSSGWAAGQVC